jgi:hypothetical protein
MALLADQPPQLKLLEADDLYESRKLTYPELMRILLGSRSRMLRSLAARRVGELGLVEFEGQLTTQRQDADVSYALVVDRALEMLRGPTNLSPTA